MVTETKKEEEQEDRRRRTRGSGDKTWRPGHFDISWFHSSQTRYRRYRETLKTRYNLIMTKTKVVNIYVWSGFGMRSESTNKLPYAIKEEEEKREKFRREKTATNFAKKMTTARKFLFSKTCCRRRFSCAFVTKGPPIG
jgi:hypothetical protein